MCDFIYPFLEEVLSDRYWQKRRKIRLSPFGLSSPSLMCFNETHKEIRGVHGLKSGSAAPLSLQQPTRCHVTAYVGTTTIVREVLVQILFRGKNFQFWVGFRDLSAVFSYHPLTIHRGLGFYVAIQASNKRLFAHHDAWLTLFNYVKNHPPFWFCSRVQSEARSNEGAGHTKQRRWGGGGAGDIRLWADRSSATPPRMPVEDVCSYYIGFDPTRTRAWLVFSLISGVPSCTARARGRPGYPRRLRRFRTVSNDRSHVKEWWRRSPPVSVTN